MFSVDTFRKPRYTEALGKLICIVLALVPTVLLVHSLCLCMLRTEESKTHLVSHPSHTARPDKGARATACFEVNLRSYSLRSPSWILPAQEHGLELEIGDR